MKKILLLLIISVCICNCKSSKRAVTKKSNTTKRSISKTTNSATVSAKEVSNIISYAKTFEGTRYKYGGTTKKGMDCSGLVVTAFKKEDVLLPRTTTDLSKRGDWVDVKDVQEGDLLFFATKKNSRKINHVGIVTLRRPGFIEFIHSTTSRGVITSRLSERYWYTAYVQARRII
ncbi:Cell wall-associated hydrolase, NlpC family [Formosa sp. Hel1_31_208]|uniref:C40 family peptidase n=1 Tax=Formosa sp. Hel1_31_208 TaxID=1798225 RepID=UPI00087BE7B4|nr:C40 family peptidase [Formosa sp. Hel1_31_208]SDR89247.1 Cell wall-associated hydrolase, NlpC family [Formosa sp. Hel1_31_208]